MKYKRIIRAGLIFLLAAAPVAVATAQDNGRGKNSIQREIYGNQSKQGKGRIQKPLSAKRAKKEQEAKIKKDNKAYAKFVKEGRKHSMDIQTPEVKERMKNNRKDSDSNYKEKRKRNSQNSRKAGRKYN
jgi:hypothetical protein